MPKIRTVKPELFKHEELYDAEYDYRLPLRIAFVGLITCCDREGRFRWQPRRLKSDVLPFDEVDMGQVLDALVERGFIKKYEYQNQWYGCIPSFLRHQRINSHESQSILPAPEGSLGFGAQLARSRVEKGASPCQVATLASELLFEPAGTARNGDEKLAHFEPPLSSEPVAENLNMNNEVGVKIEEGSDKNCLTEANKTPFVNASTCMHMHARGERKGREGNGKEWNGTERKGKDPSVASKMRPCVGENVVQKIFEHWKTVMQHPNAKLDPKRRKLIISALGFGYEAQELCWAITGCSLTPHNMGHNDRNQRFDGLHIILRDADQIDRFVRHYHSPPRLLTEAERKTQANVQTLQDWMLEKMQEANLHEC